MIKLIAETAWHHEGDYEFMSKLIDAIINRSDADIVKLHITLDLEEYMSFEHPGFDFLKARMFSENQWEQLIKKINASNKELMLLLNDKKAIDFGMAFNPSYVEVHSVCLNDIHLLTKLNEMNTKNTPVVLGVGGSTLYEIEHAITCLTTPNIILMHGFQNYPTKYEDINLKRMRKIMQLYPNYQHGYADHTAVDEANNVLITTIGASLGMNYIEKHVTILPQEKRTDWQAAVSIDDFNQIAQNIKIVQHCNANGKLELNEGEKAYSVFGPNKKAAVLVDNIKKGEKLKKDSYVFKRTAKITDLSQIDICQMHDRVFKTDLQFGHCLSSNDFE